jgi:hypothetical protein
MPTGRSVGARRGDDLITARPATATSVRVFVWPRTGRRRRGGFRPGGGCRRSSLVSLAWLGPSWLLPNSLFLGCAPRRGGRVLGRRENSPPAGHRTGSRQRAPVLPPPAAEGPRPAVGEPLPSESALRAHSASPLRGHSESALRAHSESCGRRRADAGKGADTHEADRSLGGAACPAGSRQRRHTRHGDGSPGRIKTTPAHSARRRLARPDQDNAGTLGTAPGRIKTTPAHSARRRLARPDQDNAGTLGTAAARPAPRLGQAGAVNSATAAAPHARTP